MNHNPGSSVIYHTGTGLPSGASARCQQLPCMRREGLGLRSPKGRQGRLTLELFRMVHTGCASSQGVASRWCIKSIFTVCITTRGCIKGLHLLGASSEGVSSRGCMECIFQGLHHHKGMHQGGASSQEDASSGFFMRCIRCKH